MSAVNPVVRGLNGLTNWVNDRAPGALGWWNRHAAQYYAPKNLEVPAYRFVDDNHLVVGEATKGAA